MLHFSHDIFASQRAGGVSRCMIELMRALDTVITDWQLTLGHAGNEMIDAERDEPWFLHHAVTASGGRNMVSPAVNELALRSRVARGDIVHRTYHPALNLLPRHTAVIETVHDVWDHLHGDARSPRVQLRRARRRRALHRADAIVCVSHATRNDLLNLWPRLEANSIVIHHGVRTLSGNDAGLNVDRPYFLYVGRRDLYKNFKMAVSAVAKAPRLSESGIICFGGGPLTSDEAASISQAGLADRVQILHGGDDLLQRLYRGATALLYPSRHEGFGLPVLEAMAAACPVLTTPSTSIPEIAGDAALYAAPDDLEGWINNLESIVEDAELRAGLIEAGTQRAATFTWDASARAHAKLYANLKG